MRASRVAVAIALMASVAGCASLLSLDELTPGRDARGVGGAGGSGAGGSSGDGGRAGMAGNGGDTSGHALPPPRPAGDALASGKGKSIAFVARAFFIGTLDPKTRAKDPNAWRTLGFDADGLCTTADALERGEPGACVPTVKGAAARSLADGDACRDNSFGENIAKYIGTFSTTFEADNIASTEKGGSTIAIVLDDLDDGPDDPYVPAYFYAIASEDVTPRWDGTDVRRVNAASLFKPDLHKSKLTFLDGYVRNNVWVSGDESSTGGDFTLPLGGAEGVGVPARSAVFTIPLDPGHVGAATMGQAEVVSTTVGVKDGFRPALTAYAGCKVAAVEAFLSTFDKYSDLVITSGAGYTDPTKPCDALSFGLGVQWVPARVPTEIVVVPATGGCGGAGGATGAGGGNGAAGGAASGASGAALR